MRYMSAAVRRRTLTYCLTLCFLASQGTLLLLLFLTNQAADIATGLPARILEELSLAGHFDDFSRGIVDANNIVYYLSVIVVFLFLAIRNIESRRWR